MAGAGYKLFNTGDVLTAAQVNTYLMEQTVMVFADAAARTTALTGVVSEGMISYLKDTNAVEVYNGSAWVASDDPNAIQNTIVDAKGDLITATAADTPARLAVGSNGDTLVADSAATTGLRYTAGVGLTQPVINGAFDVWQRGTSISTAGTASNYTADRWVGYRSNPATVSRQATSDSTNLPFIQYCARVQRTNANTSTEQLYLLTSLESANSIPYAGKTVTFSFYARAGANYSSASSALIYRFAQGTGTDQTIVNGFTGETNIAVGSATLTTTWQRFTITGNVASTSTQLALVFSFVPVGTAGAADYFEMTGVQIDVGSVALPFRRAGGTIQGELAAAMRYYVRLGANSGGTTAAYASYGNGYTTSTTNATIPVPLPVPMRVAPTSVDSGNLGIINTSSTLIAVSAIAINTSNNSNTRAHIEATVTGATANVYQTLVNNNNTGGFIGFSAEL
jgi:hypothetical protein